jgi:hypothetical protein
VITKIAIKSWNKKEGVPAPRLAELEAELYAESAEQDVKGRGSLKLKGSAMQACPNFESEKAWKDGTAKITTATSSGMSAGSAVTGSVKALSMRQQKNY